MQWHLDDVYYALDCEVQHLHNKVQVALPEPSFLPGEHHKQSKRRPGQMWSELQGSSHPIKITLMTTKDLPMAIILIFDVYCLMKEQLYFITKQNEYSEPSSSVPNLEANNQALLKCVIYMGDLSPSLYLFIYLFNDFVIRWKKEYEDQV